MVRKVHIFISLLPESSTASTIQIEDIIKKEAKIPLCKEIENVVVEDIKTSYIKLKNHGISSNVAKNIIDFYAK